MSYYIQRPLTQSIGLILGRSLRTDERVFHKGHMLTQVDIDTLLAHGQSHADGFYPEDSDLPEQEAIQLIADAINQRFSYLTVKVNKGGKCVCFAKHGGLWQVDSSSVTDFNLISPQLTLATLPQNTLVAPGEMVIIIKIIPLAIDQSLIMQALESLHAHLTSWKILPYLVKRFHVIHAFNSHSKDSLLDRADTCLRDRLKHLGSFSVVSKKTNYEPHALKQVLTELNPTPDERVVIIPPHSQVDALDLCGQVIQSLGGEVVAHGLPAEPGHLSLIAKLKNQPMVVLPGCARLNSKPNGIDFVLKHLCFYPDIQTHDLAMIGTHGIC